METAGHTHPGSGMTGTEKAAAVMLVMGKDSASKLADFFSKDELRRVVDAASRMQSLNQEVINKLVAEFGQNYVNTGIVTGSEGLSDFFDNLDDEESSEETGDKPRRSRPEAEVDTEETESEALMDFLAAEPEMIGAFLLGAIGEERAAKILTQAEPELRNRLFQAYLKRKTLEPEVERMLKADLLALINDLNEDDVNYEQIEKAAALINYFPEATGDELVGFIESNDPATAATIKKSLFKFSSVVELDKPARSILFDGLETEEIVQALGGADDALKDCVLEVLSQRNRRMVEAELAKGPPDQEIIESVQRKISGIALRLAKEGKIELPSAENAG